MDPAKLKDPCLFTKEEVGKTFGITITATEPETMGQMSGCTYKGDKGSLRINFIAHDPGYFDMAVASMKKMKPGRKVDFAGDPDGKAVVDAPYSLNPDARLCYRANSCRAPGGTGC